jgi:DNA-binding transcriptional LysR family regulator
LSASSLVTSYRPRSSFSGPARQGQDHLVGPLKLGVIYTIAPYLLPELILALHELAPQMPLVIEENLTSNLTAMLKNGHIDAAVVALPFDLPGISVKPLYDEPFAIVVPAKHPCVGTEINCGWRTGKRKGVAAGQRPLFQQSGSGSLPRVAATRRRGVSRYIAGNHTKYGGLRPGNLGAAV